MRTVYFKVIFFVFVMLHVPNVFACKSREFPSEYPVNEVLNNESLVVVYIDRTANVDPGNVGYTETFEGTIVKSFKGRLKVGQKVVAGKFPEQARAACPLRVYEGEAYLLVLKHVYNQLKFSRFNLVVNTKSGIFKEYVAQLEGL